MEQISTIRALVALWPTRQDFADEVGVPLARVHKWITTGAVPAKHHLAIVNAGEARDLPVSADLVVRLHAPQVDAA